MNSISKEQLLLDESLLPKTKEKINQVYATLSNKIFSDIVDKERNQYVNLVQEGGGVWGVALVGYLYALESFNIRLLRIAGTSAGAINTILIAAIGKKNQVKSIPIKEILFKWNFVDFMDGKSMVKKIANRLFQNKNIIKGFIKNLVFFLIFLLLLPLLVIILAVQKSANQNIWSYLYPLLIYIIPLIIFTILLLIIIKYYKLFQKNNIGLNPGKVFLETIKKVLAENNINSIAALELHYNQSGKDLQVSYRLGNENQYYEKALEKIKELYTNYHENIDQKKFNHFLENAKNNEAYQENPFHLLRSDYTIITTDINAKIKVELPKMAHLYWTEDEIKKNSPAEFVRASMSVPFFFEPMIKNIDAKDEQIIYAWRFWMNEKPNHINKIGVFIDGGSISNFPIDLFHESNIFYPRLPLFGVRLIDEEEITSQNGQSKEKILKTPFSFAGHIINTLRGYNDKNFLTKNSFYTNYSIQTVNCSPSNWLNFFMQEKEKIELFNKGFLAGIEFLEKFDWELYKKERMMMALKEKGVLNLEATKSVG